MRRYWIALFVAAGCTAAPAPLLAQEPATADTTYYAFTPMLEYMLHPYPIRGASIRLSTVRGDLEWPTYSVGFFAWEPEYRGGTVGIGANMMLDGPFYLGAEAGLLLLGLISPPIPMAHGRLGARLGDVGPVVEVRAGNVGAITVALGFRF